MSILFNRKWTAAEDQFIRDNWHAMTDRLIGHKINRSKMAVEKRRKKLKLNRDDEFDPAPNQERDSPFFDVRLYECWITGGPRSMEPQTIARRQAA